MTNTLLLAAGGNTTRSSSTSGPTLSSFVTTSSSIATTALNNDPSTPTMLLVYADSNNSNAITAVVVTWNGSSFTYGTPTVIITSTITPSFQCVQLSATQVFVAYNSSSGAYGGVILTISGNTITVNTKVILVSNSAIGVFKICKMSNTSILIVYGDGTGYFTQVATLSGITVTPGTVSGTHKGAFGAGGDFFCNLSALTTTTAALTIGQDSYQSHADNSYAAIVTVSGTTATINTFYTPAGTGYHWGMFVVPTSATNPLTCFQNVGYPLMLGNATISGNTITGGSNTAVLLNGVCGSIAGGSQYAVLSSTTALIPALSSAGMFLCLASNASNVPTLVSTKTITTVALTGNGSISQINASYCIIAYTTSANNNINLSIEPVTF